MFHPGHAAAIAKAHEFGDFVIVGVHADDVVTAYRGRHYPVMGLHERVLSVLSCRGADEVVIGAPFVLTRDYLDNLHVDVVVHGAGPYPVIDKLDAYDVPKQMKIFTEFESGNHLHECDIIRRVVDHRYVYKYMMMMLAWLTRSATRTRRRGSASQYKLNKCTYISRHIITVLDMLTSGQW